VRLKGQGEEKEMEILVTSEAPRYLLVASCCVVRSWAVLVLCVCVCDACFLKLDRGWLFLAGWIEAACDWVDGR
jgi:hypothetical protein